MGRGEGNREGVGMYWAVHYNLQCVLKNVTLIMVFKTVAVKYDHSCMCTRKLQCKKVVLSKILILHLKCQYSCMIMTRYISPAVLFSYINTGE